MIRLLTILLLFSATVKGQGVQQFWAMNKPLTPSCADADVLAYLSSTGITDPAYKAALCTFVTGLKSDGSWTQLDAFYILVNGTFNKCKYNLKNVAANTLTESGTITYTTGVGGGAKPNSGSYFDTHFDPSTGSPAFVTNSAHFMFYSQENINETSTDIGRFSGYSSDMELYNTTIYSTLNFLGYGSYLTSALPNTVGMFLTNRTSSTAVEIFQNTTSLSSGSITAAGVPTNSILIFTSNLSNFSTKTCAVVSIGSGISNESAYYTRVHTFLTAIGAL